MKKTVFLLALILAMALTGCVSRRWTYDLPNDYQLVRASPFTIVLLGPELRQKSPGEYTNIYVESKILRFCFNERYIGAERKLKNDVTIYYLIDTRTGTIIEEFFGNLFERRCAALGITMGDWIDTKSPPEGAVIGAIEENATG